MKQGAIVNSTALSKPPFPWFGGKRRVAKHVWEALGHVHNYVEPFAGSLAVLFGRPEELGRYAVAETVNDADGYLANFWRAVSADPEGVAYYADWPVNETDLHARHIWLVNEGRKSLQRVEADTDFFDVKIAGWWAWGINAWIGSGWCSGKGPWRSVDGELTKGDAGQGVHRKRPHLGDAGKGVHRKRQELTSYFEEYAERLRGVRVVCGDWARVCTDGAMHYGKTKGVFLDPPYLGEVRCKDLYRVDDHKIADDVREWCIWNGNRENYRIVLAGYKQEHDHLMPADWRRFAWSGSGGQSSATSKGMTNRHNEMLWFSPHCLLPDSLDAKRTPQLNLAGT